MGTMQVFVPLRIVSASGQSHTFQIEVADTDQKRMTGLMYRKTMPFDQGMLFDFKASTSIQMWMKNTYLSLDMLFIRADGTIARIAENTEPLSESIIASGEPVLAVLELVGGTSAKLGIKAGDQVDFPMFRR